MFTIRTKHQSVEVTFETIYVRKSRFIFYMLIIEDYIRILEDYVYITHLLELKNKVLISIYRQWVFL